MPQQVLSILIKFFGRQENSAHLVDLADAATEVLIISNNDCLIEDYLENELLYLLWTTC